MKVLDLILKAQDNLCFHCSKPMATPGAGDYRKWRTREHIYPRARHRWLVSNVVWAHAICNMRRGSKPPTAAMIAKTTALYAALGLTAFVNSRINKGVYAKELEKMSVLTATPTIEDAP